MFNGEQNTENVILPKSLDVGVWYGGGVWSTKKVKKSLDSRGSHTFELTNADAKGCANIKERLPKEVSAKFATDEREILENIYIACPHFNEPVNTNSRSTVVKIRMSKLEMQFFLTGDAEEETFKRINKNFFKKEEGYISFVMLPHHGSKYNNPINYLSFLSLILLELVLVMVYIVIL